MDTQFRHHRGLGRERLAGYLAGWSIGHVEVVCPMSGHKLVAGDAVEQSMHDGPL